MPRLQTAIRPVDGVERGGVLHIKGPNLMLGYYRHQRPGVIEPPRSPVGAGWYDTGDIVDVDDDGMVTIVGRVRRFAKIAGEMVSLDAVEQLARSASGAHQHAAAALLREDGAETTVLFTTDDTLTRSRLLAAARSAGAHELAVARKVVKLAQMPLLSTGKTDYVALGALIRDDTYGRLIAAAAGLSLSAPGATGGKADETNPASSPRTSR
jgi:acyl-[acyl-carrier-protein]-phospholipid O-acyltransferase/long-chain-fatty-acid--[acyl-carrier-protein] ligase